jgi:hypothetical protein
VSLAGTNQIGLLDASGGEIGRIAGPAGSLMAFDGPGKSLLVANHAIFGDPSHFSILKVYVGEK